MIKLTDEELNKWLHENVMRECWHELATWCSRKYGGIKFYQAECIKCGEHFNREEFDTEPTSENFHVQYCADLNAVSQLESKIIADVKDVAFYGGILENLLKPNSIHHGSYYYALGCAATVSARMRCEAVKIAFEKKQTRKTK